MCENRESFDKINLQNPIPSKRQHIDFRGVNHVTKVF